MKFDEDRIKLICDWLIKNKSHYDCNFYKMWLAIEILRVIIGNEWTNQAVLPNIHPTKSKATRSAIDFLRTDKLGFQFQERVYRLAQRLYDIQDITGLEKVIRGITSGDIYGGYAEIEAGSFLKRRNITFEFVIPSGKKGYDFDIKITSDPAINCEVKHKIESTLPSKEVLEITLTSANKQVPDSKPALFFIKIPEGWINSSDLKSVVKRTKGTFFPRNENVLGFVLHWEERDKINDGIFYWKYRYEENPFCSINIEEVNNKLKMSVGLEDTITSLMKKYIKKCQNYPSITRKSLLKRF